MRNSWKIYLLALITFFVGTSQFSIVGMLDKIAATAGVSVSTAGQLITVFAIGNAIGAPLIKVAMVKFNQRKQLLLALFIILFGIVSILVLPGFRFLLTSRVILGVGTGVFLVTAYSIAAKLAQPGHTAGAMSTVTMGFSSSLVFGVPIGRIVSASYGWKATFWGIGFLCLLAIFIVARIIPAMAGEASVPLTKRLAYLKNPRIAVALSVTFFVFFGYSMVNTYITPYLATALPKMDREMSVILFALGIASLIGSRLGGFLADRVGIFRTLVGAMAVQILALAILSTTSGGLTDTVILLMLWEIACWTFGPTQNFNLVSIAPEASDIALSLNISFIQFGFAAGAGIGGIAVESLSVMAIIWIGAIAAAMAAIITFLSLGRARTFARVRG